MRCPEVRLRLKSRRLRRLRGPGTSQIQLDSGSSCWYISRKKHHSQNVDQRVDFDQITFRATKSSKVVSAVMGAVAPPRHYETVRAQKKVIPGKAASIVDFWAGPGLEAVNLLS